MSFSLDVKKEIIDTKVNKKCCKRAEMLAYLAFSGKLAGIKEKRILKITTENFELAKRIEFIIKSLYSSDVSVLEHHRAKNTYYTVQMENIEDITKMLCDLKLVEKSIDEFFTIRINKNIVSSSCCQKAFVRAAFLMCGSIIDPEKRFFCVIWDLMPKA